VNTHLNKRISPVGKIAKKTLKECVFVKKIQCHVAKNTLQTAFSAILPTGSIVAG